MINWNLILKIAQVCGTQIVFSELVGDSELNVSRVCRGRKKLTDEEKKKWAMVLKCSVRDIFEAEAV